jgi:signal transduction histidine kinase
MNLITNSIKSRDPQKKEIIIEVEFEQENNKLSIHIKDNGLGIEPKNLKKIFTIGFTTRRNKGTGFGLPICKKIVEAHGGSIFAESESKNQGATFVITLPWFPM